MRKLVSFVATLAVLLNSLGAPLTVLAQEVTPTPDPTAIDTSIPTPDATVAPTDTPTDQPTASPDATPAETATPIASPESLTEAGTPTPYESPTVTQAPESNQTVQGPPSESSVASGTTEPSIQPQSTSGVDSVEHGNVTTTVVDNIDLSTINLLNSNVDVPTVTTDKPDYSPTSVVLITGTGFVAGKTYTIVISSTDEPPVTFSDSVTADSQGAFTYAYQLDGNYRPNYKIEVKDGGVIVASTTFTDAQGGTMGIDKAVYKLSSGVWTTGDAGSTVEGQWVPYQYVIKNLNANEPLPSFKITYPIFVDANNAIYFDVVSNMLFCVDDGDTNCQSQGGSTPGSLPDGTPRPPSAGSGTGIWTAFTPSAVNVALSPCADPANPIKTGAAGVTGPCETHYFTITPGSGGVPVNIGTKTRITFFFEFHLAQTPLWANALESHFGSGELNEIHANSSALNTTVLGSTLYDTWTNPFDGAGIASIGSSQHINIQDFVQNGSQGIPGGTLTLPIPTVPADLASSISGQKFEDKNGNGTKDPGENGLSGWTITLAGTFNGGGAVSFPTVTDGSGNYQFNEIFPGTYTIIETPQVAYTQTAPNNTGAGVLPNGSANPAGVTHSGGTYNLVIAGGTHVTLTGIDFGNKLSQVAPTVSTSIHNPNHNIVTTVPVGTIVHDSVTVSGSNGTPSGSIFLKWFVNNTCTGDPAATSGNISLTSGSVDATSFSQTAVISGGSFLAHYNGDTNYTVGDATCEPLAVTKLSPTISTLLSGDSVDVSSTVHDSSTLTGATSNAGGTVIYTAYTDNACTQGAQDGGTKTVTNGLVPDSNGITFNTIGDYYWQAAYSGDLNNNDATSVCTDEHLVINKVDPQITTTIHNSDHQEVLSISAGSSVHDSASVSGNVGTPTGNVDFSFFSNANCSGDGVGAGSVSLNGSGVADPSDPESGLNAGSYSFQAHYNGDGKYNELTSECEPLTVNPVTPSIETTPDTTETVLGTTINDSAALSGGVNTPTGTILFSLYRPSNQSCEGQGDFSQTVNVSGNGTYNTSPGFAAFAAGIWNWIASYSGDNNNNPVSGACGDESVTINKADTRLSTDVKNAEEESVTDSSVPLGSQVHDTSVLSGQVGNTTPTGTINYKLFLGSSCTGEVPFSSETVDLGSDSSATSALESGSYSYLAAYSGDDNYNGSVADCEPFTVERAGTTTTTQVHNANHQNVTDGSLPIDSLVHDSANISDEIEGFVLGGTVTYNFYNNGICSGEIPLTSETLKVGGESSVTNALGAGSYSYLASYSGDNNYNGSAGVCEPFRVINPQIKITKSNNSGDGISAGSTVTYTLTIENTGNVNFDNVLITDFLPGGFTYIDGSVTGADFVSFVGSKLTLNIDSLASEGTAIVTYQAQTNSNLTDGDYKNFATCLATYNEVSTKECNQTDSTVRIGHGQSFGGNLVGQVLGASTELPATGSPTGLLVLVLLAVGAGVIIRKKYVKN